MSRVLLFVDGPRGPRLSLAKTEEGMVRAMSNAARWWSVEVAEGRMPIDPKPAAAGRVIIENVTEVGGKMHVLLASNGARVEGRILASSESAHPSGGPK